MRDLQGTQLRHVVEAGNRDAADVVVVQRSVGKKKKRKRANKSVISGTVKKAGFKNMFIKESCGLRSLTSI